MTARRGWWREQRAPLIALAVLAPIAVWAALTVDAIDYWNAQPREVETVPLGEAAELGGASIRVLDTRTMPADSEEGELYAVPEGTALVAVTIEVDAREAPEGFPGCEVDLVQPSLERSWRPSIGDTDYRTGRELPDDAPGACTPLRERFPFETAFLVPADAAGEVVAEVVIPGALPRVLHLRLEH